VAPNRGGGKPLCKTRSTAPVSGSARISALKMALIITNTLVCVPNMLLGVDSRIRDEKQRSEVERCEA